jgi:hypothetical protein
VRRSRLARVAARLFGATGADDTVIAGGLAVGLHGYVRATDDVDILVRRPLAEVQARLAAKGIKSTLHREDVLEGGFPCLRGEIDGIRFDVLPELAPVAWDGAPEFKIGRVKVRVVDLEGLLALKFRAQGPQDLLDAAALVILNPRLGPAALGLATKYGVADKYRSVLGNERFRSQVVSAVGRPRRH